MTAPGERRGQPRFVFFDLDGTLYDVVAATDAALVAALEMGCDSLGLDKQSVSNHKNTFWQEYFLYANQAVTSEPEEVLPVLFHRTLGRERSDGEANHDLWDHLTRVWLDRFMVHAKPFPQVVELLNRLQKGGIGRGIISNGGGRWQRLKLTALGLNDYFPEENLFFSDERGLAKPETGIFRLALDSCGMSASETIFVGDSPVTDLTGALTVGLNVIWLNRYELVPPSTSSNLPGRLFEAASFPQAAELVEELLALA